MTMHIERWMPAEWPGVAVMQCGATCLIAENGDTTPAGFDFCLPQHAHLHRGICGACRVLTPKRRSRARRAVSA